MRKIRRILITIICLFLFIGSLAGLVPRAYAASEMTASDACVDFIKKTEGFSSLPYFDYSQYTVGYGTKCPTEKYLIYKSNGITKTEAEALLRQELADVEDAINKKFIDKNNLTLSQHQFDALVSFSFNIGTGWMTSNSTLKNTILNNGNENDLVYAFGLYCSAGGKYLPGLITRRLCEANMYLNGVYSQNISEDFGYVYYDANGGSITYRVQGFVCEDNIAPSANPVRSGDVFLGWYTDLTGGQQVDTLSGALTGKTLFARWQSSENPQDQDSGSTATQIKVTGDVVNIRSGPGTNYGTVKQVYRNTALTISHVTHLTNMKWGKVPGGWICLDYTNYDAVVNWTGNSDAESNDTPSDEVIIPDSDSTGNDTNADISQDEQEVVSGIVKVGGYLNIRTGPGTTYPTAGFLFNNTKVKILEQQTAGTTLWGRIEKGWICMDYIVTEQDSTNGTTDSAAEQEQENPSQQAPADSANKTESVSIKGKITADALRIRSGAGTANSIVGFYYQNDSVVVTEKVLVGSVYWGKTSRGWISMEYVSADSSAGESTQPAEDSAKTVIADCLRIRKEAGTEHKIVGFLYYSDTVTVQETKTVDGTAWGRVNKGWICMQYVN